MDQCKHCTLKGNLVECEKADCTWHELWYVNTLKTNHYKHVDRKTILLMACRDMLLKCKDSPYVISPMETTVFYDDANCDGYCLLEDIEVELDTEM